MTSESQYFNQLTWEITVYRVQDMEEKKSKNTGTILDFPSQKKITH
jgi:hypothetical protein